MATSPVNVLIVDDDRSVQRVLAEALTKQGFVVTVERDGEWAAQTFEKKHFDAVILDLLLPALSGYEVAKRIRATKKGKATPIIMISGVYKNPMHHREATTQHGAFALLEKPLDLRLVVHTLKGALGDRVPVPEQPKAAPPPEEEDDKTGEFFADDAQREEAALVEAKVPSRPAQQRPPPPAKAPARPTIPERAPVPVAKPQPAPARTSKAKPKPPAKPQKPAPPVHEPDPATVLDIPPPVPDEPPPPPVAPPAPKDEAPWASVADKPFATLLAEAYRSRFSGAVRLRRGTVKKIVYFRNGTPDSVKSNLLVECLGRVLVKERLISEAECEESLKRMKSSRRMQGTVLIEMGCLSPHNLQRALELQLQHKLYDVFAWDDGEYQFNAGVPLPSDPTSLGMTAAQIIYEGVKRAYDEQRLGKIFIGASGQYVTATDNPLYALADAGLATEEQELLELADGHKTLATLRALALLPPFETDRFFFAMQAAQMVTLSAQPTASRPRVSLTDLAARKQKKSAPIKPPPLPPALPKKKAPEVPWTDPSAAVSAAPTAPAPPPMPKSSPQPPPKPAASLLPELSQVVSLPRVSGEEGALREKLATRFSAMRKLDYFELLGVQRTATREDVKRAYFQLAREYHPDKHYSSASAEVRELAQQLYDLISTAHDTLTSAEDRKRYVLELNSGEIRKGPDADVGRILAAEGRFQKGEELMRNRQYADALKQFREAISLYPDEGEFHAWEGWALFQTAPAQVDDSVRAIERSISLNPRLDKSYLFLGYIYKASGRPDRAERQFEKAIQCNPDCTEALRELRLLGQKR